MEFHEALGELGFVPAQERSARGVSTYAARPNPYLTYWVHLYEDGAALFTWEFAITDYLSELGIQLGSSEALNVFMFPREDDRGPQDSRWLAQAMDRAEDRLRAVRLLEPGV